MINRFKRLPFIIKMVDNFRDFALKSGIDEDFVERFTQYIIDKEHTLIIDMKDFVGEDGSCIFLTYSNLTGHLRKDKFIKGVDYLPKTVHRRGRTRTGYTVSASCFKKLCDDSDTPKGKEIIRKYTELEKLYEKYTSDSKSEIDYEVIVESDSEIDADSDNDISSTKNTDYEINLDDTVICVTFREKDGYANINEICHIYDRKFFYYKKLKSSAKLLIDLSTSKKIDIDKLCTVIKDGSDKGIWVHPQIAVDLAYWVSVELGGKMSTLISDVEKIDRIKLQNDIREQQISIIGLKKQLNTIVKKNCDRHKFPAKTCIYVVQNPNDHLSEYKFGKTTNINNRLKTYRTSIPDVKVLLIIYTEHHDKFEDIVKMQFAKELNFRSHEWISGDKDNIVDTITELNIKCKIYGEIETELWKYNLEEPPKVVGYVGKKEPKELTEQAQQVSKHGKKKKGAKLVERLAVLVENFLTVLAYNKKNAKAPDDHRWCNGFCQKYLDISSFTPAATGFHSACETCRTMESIATEQISAGVRTVAQIRKNPHLVRINDGQRMCVTCKNIKDGEEFERVRRICKTCRKQENKTKIDRAHEGLDEVINNFWTMSATDLEIKLKDMVKDVLIEVIKRLKIGRKSTDKVNDMRKNIFAYVTLRKEDGPPTWKNVD
jgi:hypothetical protein